MAHGKENHNNSELFDFQAQGKVSRACIAFVACCREDPDVVYLQEVVPESVRILEENCPMYQLVAGGATEYFTVIMLKVRGEHLARSSRDFLLKLKMRLRIQWCCGSEAIGGSCSVRFLVHQNDAGVETGQIVE